MARNIPPELVRHILEYLCHDNVALRTCALVHSAWLPICYSHLFRHVSVYHRDLSWLVGDHSTHDCKGRTTTMKIWLKSLAETRHLRDYIKSLKIEVTPPSCLRYAAVFSAHPERCLTVCPGQVLKAVDLLPALTSLTLSGPEFRPRSTFQPFPRQRELRHLTMSGIDARSDHLFLFLRQFSRISVLSYSDDLALLRDTKDSYGEDSPRIQGLHTLNISDSYLRPALLEGILLNFDLDSLSTLSIAYFIWEPPILDRARSALTSLVHAATNLESLTFEMPRTGVLSDAMTFSCPHLRRLCVPDAPSRVDS